MSKKKNTLKDLDEFLKQQAATLVTPQKLSTKTEESTPSEPVVTSETPPPGGVISADTILDNLKQLSQTEANFRKQLYDIIIGTLEAQNHSLPEDKMLINTALYLKHGESWKEAIRDYWRNSE